MEAYHDIERTGYGDYTLNAHFRFIRQMLGRAERFCFYTEKKLGMFVALAAAFRDEILDDRLEAFQVKITKEMSMRLKWSLVGQAKAEFPATSKTRAQRFGLAKAGSGSRTSFTTVELDAPEQRLVDFLVGQPG